MNAHSHVQVADPDVVINIGHSREDRPLHGWQDNKNLNVLNLVYDCTPSEYIKMIISEVGMVPPTSVPVILREFVNQERTLNKR